jgi:hypothetical protein
VCRACIMSDRSIGLLGAALTVLGTAAVALWPDARLLWLWVLAAGIAMLLWALIRDRKTGHQLLAWRRRSPMSPLIVGLVAAVAFGSVFGLGFWPIGSATTPQQTDGESARMNDEKPPSGQADHQVPPPGGQPKAEIPNTRPDPPTHPAAKKTSVRAESHGPNSPAASTSGDNSPITINAAQQGREPIVEGVTISQRQIPSPRPDAPIALELTVQVRAPITPFAIGVICDRPIVGGDFRVTGTSTSRDVRIGTMNDAPDRSYYLSFTDPPVAPWAPLIITLFGVQDFTVLKVIRLQQ